MWRPQLQVWLKRRKNPITKNGKRTVSFTLQWRDLCGKDRFKSLGNEISEDEAKAEQEAFQKTLNENHTGNPERFIEQFKLRSLDDYEKLVLSLGSDPRLWSIWSMLKDRSDWEGDFHYLADLYRERGSDVPFVFYYQFHHHHLEDLRILVEHFGSAEAVLLDVKQRLLFNKPATVEQHLLELADEWRWSEDPVTFEKQFIERYPEEFAALREKLPDISIARRMKRADLPPLEVVQKLKNLVKDAPDTYDPAFAEPYMGRSIVRQEDLADSRMSRRR